VPVVHDTVVEDRGVPALSALNSILRDDYLDDCQKGVDRWNRALQPVGAELTLPHVGFHRAVGAFAGSHLTPDGRVIAATEWAAGTARWLPTDADREHIGALMHPVTEPGQMASWLAPPASGIHAKPVEFEYVR
jgi:benzoyl-CoA 2,3-dioxygenase component B